MRVALKSLSSQLAAALACALLLAGCTAQAERVGPAPDAAPQAAGAQAQSPPVEVPEPGEPPAENAGSTGPLGERSEGRQSTPSMPGPDLDLTEAVVTRVVDGDTVWVRITDTGAREKVRLIGIDTPESTTRVEPYGHAASAYTRRHLDGATVLLETDVERRDRYGRLLAYVWMSEPTAADENGLPTASQVRHRLFNAWLVRDGFAQVMTIPPNVKYAEHFLRLQREARERGRGLWGSAAEGSDASGAVPRTSRAGAPYIGNRRSMKFHRAECRWVAEMSPANRVPFASRSAAVAAGYVPCKVCWP